MGKAEDRLRKKSCALLLLLLFRSAIAFSEMIPPTESRSQKPKYGYVAIQRHPSSMGGESLLSIGFEGMGDLMFAQVPYSTALTSGLGFGASLPFGYRLSPRVRATASLNYQVVRLSRNMQASGAVVEPITTVRQSISYLGLGLLGGFLVSQPNGNAGLFKGKASWWLEGGFVYLAPLSGTQTNVTASGESSFAFSSTDHPLFALLGVSSHWKLIAGFNLVGRIYAQYNVFATAGSRAFGVKSTVGVELTL